ncbi:MAG: cyclic-di-AMP receptor [Bacillota bacterium]
MKLVVAVIQDKDTPKLVEALVAKGLRATKLASTGGFLRQGNTTLLVGVDDAKLNEVLKIIKETCQTRQQMVAPMGPMGGGAPDSFAAYPIEVVVGGATVFILNVERFERM